MFAAATGVDQFDIEPGYPREAQSWYLDDGISVPHLCGVGRIGVLG